MARKIELSTEDINRIKEENEKKRRALFNLHSNTQNDNELTDDTIEKIGAKLELLKSPVKYTDTKNTIKNHLLTDNLSVPTQNNTDKKTVSSYLNITDNLSDTDISSVTDKKTVTDKISEPIFNLTDKKTVLSETLTDNKSERDKMTVSNSLTICQDILHNFRGYLIEESIKIQMILDINLNSELPFSARNFLTVLLSYTTHTWFDLSIYKFLKFANLEERNFYRFRKDIDKVCHVEVINKTTVFNFIDLYLKHSENTNNDTENITDKMSVSNHSKLVSNNTNLNLLTNIDTDKKTVTDNLSGTKKASSFLVKIATEDFLKKVFLIPGFDTEGVYSKNTIKQIAEYQSDHINEKDKDLNLLALCLYSKEKCNQKQNIYGYVFSSLKHGALDSLVNNYKEKASHYVNMSFENIESKSLQELKNLCQICNLNQAGSWGDLNDRLKEKKDYIDNTVSKLLLL